MFAAVLLCARRPQPTARAKRVRPWLGLVRAGGLSSSVGRVNHQSVGSVRNGARGLTSIRSEVFASTMADVLSPKGLGGARELARGPKVPLPRTYHPCGLRATQIPASRRQRATRHPIDSKTGPGHLFVLETCMCVARDEDRYLHEVKTGGTGSHLLRARLPSAPRVLRPFVGYGEDTATSWPGSRAGRRKEDSPLVGRPEGPRLAHAAVMPCSRGIKRTKPLMLDSAAKWRFE